MAKPRINAKDGTDRLRIRMYRVGFGDFFLVTAWSKKGPQHILIDCGVTRGKTGKGDLASIKTSVRHMAEETGNKLALIVMTHRHQDHIIGFSRCQAEFEAFKGNVGAIWMPTWEKQYPKIQKFQDDLASVAMGLRTVALAGDGDPSMAEILGIAENATGVSSEGPGGGTNQKSLELLKHKLGVKPSYYAHGDTPKLPAELVEAGFSAEILGPPPPSELDFVQLMDLKRGVGQYWNGGVDARAKKGRFLPFAPEFVTTAEAYPPSAYREWAPRMPGIPPDELVRYPEALQAAVKGATPAALLTAARKLDSILNNQSLVTLFTWRGKRLLFAGDAQAGSWIYWLYDLDKPTKKLTSEQLSERASTILSSLSFYKAGHHGSTNSTPIAAVEAMRGGFVTMCSTQADTFGHEDNDSEVPRIPLMNALARKSVLVRSDHFAAKIGSKRIPAVRNALKTRPPKVGKLEVHEFYVDYIL